jgi:hypothetical protein
MFFYTNSYDSSIKLEAIFSITTLRIGPSLSITESILQLTIAAIVSPGFLCFL